MCGIVGFVSNQKEKKKTIKEMADTINHRGPDGEGYYVDQNVALGHKRLSIIDINGGAQPMYNDQEDVVIVYNGEIYNYLELKSELEQKYEFKTNCDTEVLVHGYEEWGSDLPSKLRGMFAFAIWDKNKQKLFCARDPFGIKPFYYYHKDDTFLFASEIKAMLVYPGFEKELNRDLLGSYLQFSFTPTNETFFKHVYRLDAGSSLTYQKGNLEIEKYYHMEFKEIKEEFEESVKRIEEVMKESVQSHLISDVEVGSFLSSGVDSSYIVSLARPDKTYTVGYESEKYSEISYAKDLAQKLDIKNITKLISKEEYLSIVPKIMYHMDEPFSDPAGIALYFLSEIASKDVKVVLSGEGADEFFAGYGPYREIVDMGFYNKIPYPIRHFIAVILKLLPEFRGRNFLVRRGEKIENSYVGTNRLFSEKECKHLLAHQNPIKVKDILYPVMKDYTKESDLIKMQVVDLNFWLVKDILHKADRMTMAHSVELRVPFIDKEVFAVASSLGEDKKINKTTTKVALREAAKSVTPGGAYKKPKLGFPVPLREWITESDYKEEIEKTIKQDFVKEFFNQDYALHLLDVACEKKDFTYKKVWGIYTFIKWYEVFFLNRNEEVKKNVSEDLCLSE